MLYFFAIKLNIEEVLIMLFSFCFPLYLYLTWFLPYPDNVFEYVIVCFNGLFEWFISMFSWIFSQFFCMSMIKINTVLSSGSELLSQLYIIVFRERVIFLWFSLLANIDHIVDSVFFSFTFHISFFLCCSSNS